jgi:hypothetical protein
MGQRDYTHRTKLFPSVCFLFKRKPQKDTAFNRSNDAIVDQLKRAMQEMLDAVATGARRR